MIAAALMACLPIAGVIALGLLWLGAQLHDTEDA